MQTVWKVTITDRVEIVKVPVGYKVLSTAIQNRKPVVWIQVDPDECETVSITLKAVATGEVNVKDGDQFIGTLMFINGAIVEHIYLER